MTAPPASPKPETCPRCHGTGMDPDSDAYSPLVCDRCSGSRRALAAESRIADLARDVETAREALRGCVEAMEIVSERHRDMSHTFECPIRAHEDGDCGCVGDQLDAFECVDGECECCLSTSAIGSALATARGLLDGNGGGK